MDQQIEITDDYVLKMCKDGKGNSGMACFDKLENPTHRYSLARAWAPGTRAITFIGVNPSRADHENNDNTITKCIKFAKAWGYDEMRFMNLYSYRTPYVYDLPLNRDTEFLPLVDVLDRAKTDYTDQNLKLCIELSERVVCCWGTWKFKGFVERAAEVRAMIKEPYVFGLNADGQPKHPLYLPDKSIIKPWQ